MKEKKTFMDGDQEKILEETKMKEGIENFIPLSEALNVDWTSEKYARRLARTTPSYFIMHCKSLDYLDDLFNNHTDLQVLSQISGSLKWLEIETFCFDSCLCV